MSDTNSQAYLRQFVEYVKAHSNMYNEMLQRSGANCFKCLHKWKLNITSGITFISVISLLNKFTNTYGYKQGEEYSSKQGGKNTVGNSNFDSELHTDPEIFHFIASRLKKDEYSYKLACSAIGSLGEKQQGSGLRVSGYDSNTLGSNDPNEDRNVEGMLMNGAALLFAVFDGHKGQLCSEALKQQLLETAGHQLGPLLSTRCPLLANSSINPIVLDQRPGTHSCPVSCPIGFPSCDIETGLSPSAGDEIAARLQETFVSMDQRLEQRARQAAQKYQRTKTLSREELENLKRFYQGSCALTTCVVSNQLYLANTGDCRAVLGSKIDGKWTATALTTDQTANNADEMIRIFKAHPGERVIRHGRLLGGLMPLRSFGDAEYKWPSEYLKDIVSLSPNYHTPPYLTAEPVITHHTLSPNDKFLVLATDGLWEKLTNEQVVQLLGKAIDGQKQETRRESWFSDLFYKIRKPADSIEVCPNSYSTLDTNLATYLIRQALGGDSKSLYSILNLSPAVSRSYRDDISVTVLYFNEEK